MRTYDQLFNLLYSRHDWQITPLLEVMPEPELWMIIEETPYHQRNFEMLAARELVRRRRSACLVMEGDPSVAPKRRVVAPRVAS